jgi:hypothetical protein
MTGGREARWLLLIHQIPPRPAYLRVKTGRRLQALGAVAVKNSVYVLPLSDDALEDFQWVRREIVAGGGDASVCEAHFVEGLSDAGVEALFDSARDADYAELVRQARRLHGSLTRSRRPSARSRERASAVLLRLRRRLEELTRIDFFGAQGRGRAEGILTSVESILRPAEVADVGPPPLDPGSVRGRRWVTRSGVYVDRIASAWLIRRFIDPEASFAFVERSDAPVSEGDLRFDMFEAEFTHEAEQCTFEVLLRRFGLEDPALRQLGEIVHDLDLKDARFARPEAAGLESLIAGIALRHRDDTVRLREGGEIFEALYEFFKRGKRASPVRPPKSARRPG